MTPLQISPTPATVQPDPLGGSVCSSGTQCSSEDLVGGERSMLEGGRGETGKPSIYPLGPACCSPDSSHSHHPRQPWPSSVASEPHPLAPPPAFPVSRQQETNREGRGRAGRKGLAGKALQQTHTQLCSAT